MGMTGNILRVTNTELEEYLNDSALLEKRVFGETVDPNLIDIDKSWEGIFFLLTGNSIAEEVITDGNEGLGRVLFSGKLIDEEQDMGYGPANYLTPEDVIELNQQLVNISVDDITKKFDPDKMNEAEIYPTGWDDSMLPYLLDSFTALKAVFAKAAQNREAIITFLN